MLTLGEYKTVVSSSIVCLVINVFATVAGLKDERIQLHLGGSGMGSTRAE